MSLFDLFRKRSKQEQSSKKAIYIRPEMFVVAPNCLTKEEKETIYNLYQFIQRHPKLIDTKLRTLVNQNIDEMSQFDVLTTNFPNLIDMLWTYGYEETLFMCSEDRRRKMELMSFQEQAKADLSQNSNVTSDYEIFDYLVHLRALEMFLDKYQITDDDLQDMIERYPDDLALYGEMYQVTDLVYDIRMHDYMYPATKIASYLYQKSKGRIAE